MSESNAKKSKGQFYTVNHQYILQGLSAHPSDSRCIIEPFAGRGDLLDWISETKGTLRVEAYDIDPKREDIAVRDTLLDPPNYDGSWIITNPPYLARNKCESKIVFDKYGTNDLYKCFINSLTEGECCRGGILIIPAGFFLSPRPVDAKCRNAFLTKYKLLKVNYFEETVFPDTPTTVVAFAFERALEPLEFQDVEWVRFPSKEGRTFRMSSDAGWIIGGDIYNLPIKSGIKVRRWVGGDILKEGEQQTCITLSALDSGTQEGRICLEYKEGYVYQAKDTSRTYATICISGLHLSIEQQKTLCTEFNDFIENKRSETWSLFLPQFRESKEYARKRIPFGLAYSVIIHIIQTKLLH